MWVCSKAQLSAVIRDCNREKQPNSTLRKSNGQYGPLDWCIISLIDCFRIVQCAICFCNVFKKSSRANAQVVYRRQHFCSGLHAPLSYNITSTQMLLRTLCVISSRAYFKQIWHFISSADKLHKILLARNLCKCLCCMRITRLSITNKRGCISTQTQKEWEASAVHITIHLISFFKVLSYDILNCKSSLNHDYV